MAVKCKDDGPRDECLRHFDDVEHKLDLVLAGLARIGRIEGAARLLGYLVTTSVALAALWLATGAKH